jgi:glycosyltransferase involved in cell wall biosynthesis
VHRHPEVRSASYARNQGLQYATGDFICFFDDDDDMFPQYIEKFVSAFEAHPFAKIVRCGMIVDNGTINYSYATPECCIRTEYATRTWKAEGPGQDQKYFKRIINTNNWRMDREDGVLIEEALCRANAHPVGGLRSGNY